MKWDTVLENQSWCLIRFLNDFQEKLWSVWIGHKMTLAYWSKPNSDSYPRKVPKNILIIWDIPNIWNIPNIFSSKTRLAGGIPLTHRHCKFSFGPKPGRRSNLDKSTVRKGAVGLFDFHFLTILGWVLWGKAMLGYCDAQFFKTHVTPRQKVEMSQVAYPRMLAGGWEVVKFKCAIDRATPKMTYERNAMKLFWMQCGSMEAHALGFVLHTAGSGLLKS